MAKGFTSPISSTVFPIDDQLIDARQTLTAKRNLALIFSSKSATDIHPAPSDVVEIYVKQENKKRGKWSSPKTVLSYDRTRSTVTVPGASGRTIRAATEDIRPPP